MNKLLIEKITDCFKATFKTQPLLIFSPGRINLIGEHTDYNNGFVFPAAIHKGIYVAIEKSKTHVSTAIALDVKSKFEFTTNFLKRFKKGSWKNYLLGVVSEIKKKGKSISNFNLVFAGDIPNGAGLSSSAALENAIVYGLNELFQLGFTKEEMIFISQKAEHNFVGVQCGIMDQYASMFGEENTAILLDCKELKTKHYKIDFKEYDLLLINTNVKHSLADSAYNERRSVCKKVATFLKVDSLRETTLENINSIKNQISEDEYQKATFILQENERVLKASDAIENNDLKSLGSLMYQSHDGLQKQYKVSCVELDFLIELALENKAVLGARMMGGGFGGCTINLIKKEEIAIFTNTVKQQFNAKFNSNCSFYNIQLSNGTQQLKTS
jgi:galactokinase